MKKIVIIALAMLVLANGLLFSQAQKETEKTYVFAANCAWPPLEFVDENGDIVGFEIDLVHEIAKVNNVKITIRNVAWEGIFAGLANGAYDAVASGVSVTEERKATMDFSTPIMIITQSILTPISNRVITNTASLNNKKVGVQLGTTGHIFLEDFSKNSPSFSVNIKAYDEIGFAIEDMLNGNLDAVVTDSVIASDYVLSNPNYASKLKVAGSASDLGDPEPIAIATLKGNKEVLDLVNNGLREIQASGKMDELKKKWNIL
ncbi:MAG: basic amino acid ABC transporter substrate-binding protein [Spirochaetia bacterium]|nr:basic amino acid ABC transporter substrate-binding protein [Spirochaetia bacterium]